MLIDLNQFFDRLVPDGDPLYDHKAEELNVMQVHIRTDLKQTQLSIPERENRMALGIW